jgi:hypothetical protein
MSKTLSKRFLLYLDILGFRQLAANPARVRELYRIVNSLRVHRDGVLKAIIFADTLLVYSPIRPTDFAKPDEIRDMIIFRFLEFVRDLLRRTTGRDFYFRAFITFGEFIVDFYEHFRAFHGRGLIAAYEREQSLKCAGLFIDDYSNRYNTDECYPTRKYSVDCSFVYMLDCLHRIDRERNGADYPLAEDGFWSGNAEQVVWQIHLLRDIYNKMLLHPEPDVRAKFLATWSLYRQQYPQLTEALATNDFNPRALMDFDWTTAEASYERIRKNRYRPRISTETVRQFSIL